MKLSSLSAAIAVLNTITAHTVFTTLFVDNVDQGDGTCVRMPKDPGTVTNPINDLASNDMACGFNGTRGVARVCPVNPSSKLSFLFREYADGSQPGSLDPVHRGPCAVYMKPVDSAINDTAIGGGWFKIWDEGYDSTTSQWCTEKLMKNNGLLSVNIPSDLAGGYYLVRPELLALHQADKNPPNPQFYVGCAQIFLKSTSSTVPEHNVSIPGYTNIGDPSVLFNIWSPKFPYPMLGPKAYKKGSSAIINRPALLKQSEGILPENAILTNANWWGTEVASYSTEDGCWNASKACFGQLASCFENAPPTGSSGCKIWESKCTKIQKGCNEKIFSGPKSFGRDRRTPTSRPTPPTIKNPIDSESRSMAVYPPVERASVVIVTSYLSNFTPMASKPTVELNDQSPTKNDANLYTGVVSTSESESSTLSPTPMLRSNPTMNIDMPPLSSLKTSLDGKCGSDQTCLQSEFGSCCSSHGWCGSGKNYCDEGCVPDFGLCSSLSDFLGHSTLSDSTHHLGGETPVPNNGGGRLRRRATKTITVFEPEASPFNLPSRDVVTIHTTSMSTFSASSPVELSSGIVLPQSLTSITTHSTSSTSISTTVPKAQLARSKEVLTAFSEGKVERGINYGPQTTWYPPFIIPQVSDLNICRHGQDCDKIPLSNRAHKHNHAHKHLRRDLPVRDALNQRCGERFGQKCHGNGAYKCCSKWNWCGSEVAHCGSGCQRAWGECYSGFPIGPFI